MDKYVEIITEPKFNDSINLKLLEKETLSKYCKILRTHDNKRLYKYDQEPVYKHIYTKRPRKSKKVLAKGDIKYKL